MWQHRYDDLFLRSAHVYLLNSFIHIHFISNWKSWVFFFSFLDLELNLTLDIDAKLKAQQGGDPSKCENVSV